MDGSEIKGSTPKPRLSKRKWVAGAVEDGGGKPSNKRLISIWGFVLITMAFLKEWWFNDVVRIEVWYIIGGVTGAVIMGITMEGIFALLKFSQMGNWWGGFGNTVQNFFKKGDDFQPPSHE